MWCDLPLNFCFYLHSEKCLYVLVGLRLHLIWFGLAYVISQFLYGRAAKKLLKSTYFTRNTQYYAEIQWVTFIWYYLVYYRSIKVLWLNSFLQFDLCITLRRLLFTWSQNTVCAFFFTLHFDFVVARSQISNTRANRDGEKERNEKLAVDRLFLKSFKFWNVLLSCLFGLNLISYSRLYVFMLSVWEKEQYIWLTVVACLWFSCTSIIHHNVLEFRNVGMSVAVL